MSEEVKKDYFSSLSQIVEHLLGHNQNVEYVLNHFYENENIELEEMFKAEEDMTFRQKFEFKMQAKQETMNKCKARLTNFKNDKFKSKCAELVYWMHYVLDGPNTISTQEIPIELVSSLEPIRKFNSDIELLCEDINRKFKTISLSIGLPKP